MTTPRKRHRIALMTYAIDNRPAKGTALYARKLVEHLIARGEHDYYLVHYETSDDPIYLLGASEILMPTFRLPFGSRFVRQLMFFWKYRDEPFDIVHWFQPRLYPFYWLAPARHRIVTAHGAGDITAPGPFSLSRLMFNVVLRYFNRPLAAIIGVSEFGRQEIVDEYRTIPGRTHAILQGGSEDFHTMREDEIAEPLKRYGIRRPYILSMSRHVRHKNIGGIISAYDAMRQAHPERAETLIIVGTKSHAFAENEQKRLESLFSEDIYFIDFISAADLNAVYAGAAVFVFPSLNEGFGLPVIEAFASGTPVVTSTVTALPEVAGDAALLVDPCDIKALSTAMHRVLSDRELYETLRQKGMERAQKFTWQKTADATSDLYDSVLGYD